VREWSLKQGDPLSLTLAFDARLGPTDYTDDQIWELSLAGGDPIALAKRLDRAFDLEYILLPDAIVVVGIHKRQRQYPDIDQVLPVDAGKALGNHDLQAEILTPVPPCTARRCAVGRV